MVSNISTFYEYFKEKNAVEIFDRLNLLTQYFLGKPYILGAQGEGEEGDFDQFPLYRFDGFDCVTFVNNLLALAISDDEVSFKSNLLKINYYNAKPLFQNRFHFMSLDWNPQNQKTYLTDITEKIVDKNNRPIAMFAEGIIDKRNWFLYRTEKDIRLDHAQNNQEKCQELKKLSTLFKPEFVRLPYLPIQMLLENLSYFDQFPDVTIIEIVRPNWNLCEKIGTNLHVSHVGFGLRSPSGEILFCHASSEQKGVVQNSLINYLGNTLKSETVKGIHIHSIKKP